MILNAPVVAYLVLLLASGYALASLLAPRASGALRAGWSWLLGGGLLAFGLGVSTVLGLPPAPALALVALPLLLWPWLRRWSRSAPGARALAPAASAASRQADAVVRQGWPQRARPFWPAAVLLLGSLPALAMTTPLPAYDGLAIWGYKAKILFAEGRLPPWHLEATFLLPARPEYPLGYPLIVAGLAHARGGWHDGMLALVILLSYASLILILAGAVESACHRWGVAAVLTLGVALLPRTLEEVPLANADLFLAACLAGTLAALQRWLETSERGTLVLAALCAGLGAWVKLEGAVLFAIALAAAWLVAGRSGGDGSRAASSPDPGAAGPGSSWRREAKRAGPRRDLLLAVAIGLALALPWHLFRLAHGVPEGFGVLGPPQLERIPVILESFAADMLRMDKWGVLWPLSLVASVVVAWIVFRRRQPPSVLLPALFLFVGLGGYAAIYVVTPYDLLWHLDTSLDRLLLHLLPAGVLAIGAAPAAVAALRSSRSRPFTPPSPRSG